MTAKQLQHFDGRLVHIFTGDTVHMDANGVTEGTRDMGISGRLSVHGDLAVLVCETGAAYVKRIVYALPVENITVCLNLEWQGISPIAV